MVDPALAQECGATDDFGNEIRSTRGDPVTGRVGVGSPRARFLRLCSRVALGAAS